MKETIDKLIKIKSFGLTKGNLNKTEREAGDMLKLFLTHGKKSKPEHIINAYISMFLKGHANRKRAKVIIRN